MNSAIYFPNNNLTKENINKVILKYELQEFTCSQSKEKVFKNKDLVLFLTKNYVFIRTFLNEDTQIIKSILMEGII